MQTSIFILYTYQNAKTTHFVDNIVDNVENRLWISHTISVYI